MPRTKGATNRPKNDDYHINELENRGFTVTKGGQVETVDVPNKGKSKIKKQAKPTPNAVETANFLTGETTDPAQTDAEPDNFVCGNCNSTLEGKVEKCPHCGVALIW